MLRRLFVVAHVVSYMAAAGACADTNACVAQCESLAGVPAVFVTVVVFDESMSVERRVDLEMSVRDSAMARLRKRAVPVTDTYRPGAPAIIFNIIFASGGAYAIETVLSEDVRLMRGGRGAVTAATWNTVTVGTVQSRSIPSVRNLVSTQADVFAADYASVN